MSEVCEATSIPHVHIETGRLLSAIVKYCQDESKDTMHECTILKQ